MAGLIARLFGGRDRPPDPNPLPGIGGYSQGEGPDGEFGFPGSTSRTRTLRGTNPRIAKVQSDTNYGFEQGLGPNYNTRQVSYRGDERGARCRSPRATPRVATPQPTLVEILQNNSSAEFYGGPMLRTGPGNNTAGANPLTPAQRAGGHSSRDTTTPWVDAQPVLPLDAPGSSNVRNQVAQRYKNRPGQMITVKSSSRPDQAPVNPGGQATDGNVHPERVIQDVVVQNRFVMEPTTWSVNREMPYAGRGNGARGADLNGQRYYGQFNASEDQFANAGRGDYGIARERGGKRPVSFTQPAPWSSNFYDTTDEVGTADTPNPNPGQVPNSVYVSPSASRTSRATRTA